MGQSPKILVVDDEVCILHSTAMILSEFGYTVATCQSAADIRGAIEREEPDVVLQDLRMPGLDLEHLAFDLRQDPRWRKLPIVIFTASMEIDEVVQRVGAAGLIEKPFRPAELQRALESAMARAGAA